MTRTASQKARAKAARSNNSNPTSKPQKSKASRNPNKVQSRGADILSQPSRRVTIPKTYFKVIGETTYKGKPCMRFRGKDFVKIANFLTSTGVGAAVVNAILCPSLGAFSGTRLAREASLYEKFLFTNLTLSVDSGAGTGVNGSYLLAYDKDPSDATPTGTPDDIMREYYGMDGTQSFQAGVSGSVSFPLSDTQEFYYTNPAATGLSDERLFAQGQIYVAVGTQQWSSNVNMGVYIEYDVLFFDPELGSIVDEGKMNISTFTPSNSNGQAWPVTNIPDAVNQVIGDGIKKITDSTGTYRGYSLDAGVYLLEQMFANNTAVQTISAPQIVAYDPSKQTSIVDTVLDAVASIAGGTAFRAEKLTIPFGGATLFGTVAAATANTGALVRIWNLGRSDIF